MEIFDVVLLLSIFTLFALLSFSRFYKKNKRKECLFSYIKWIYDKAQDRRDFNLLTFLYSLQIKRKYDDQECLLDRENEQEMAYAKEILDIYTNTMITSYFNGLCYTDKKCYNLDSEEHYLFSLWRFLQRIEEYPTMPVYSKLKDKVYSEGKLTDFGSAYYKLYFIATKFCESNNYTRDFLQTTSEQIKEYLKKHYKEA
jgi:hypothetical protein